MTLVRGKLVVVVVLGQNLKDSDWIGKQDPYCKLRCGSQTFRTKTASGGGTNPIWNETFQFESLTNENTLAVEVYDADLLSKDDLLGSAEVDLAAVREQGEASVEAALVRRKGKQGRDRQQGTVSLRLTFEPSEPKPKQPSLEQSQPHPEPVAPVAGQMPMLPVPAGYPAPGAMPQAAPLPYPVPAAAPAPAHAHQPAPAVPARPSSPEPECGYSPLMACLMRQQQQQQQAASTSKPSSPPHPYQHQQPAHPGAPAPSPMQPPALPPTHAPGSPPFAPCAPPPPSFYPAPPPWYPMQQQQQEPASAPLPPAHTPSTSIFGAATSVDATTTPMCSPAARYPIPGNPCSEPMPCSDEKAKQQYGRPSAPPAEAFGPPPQPHAVLQPPPLGYPTAIPTQPLQQLPNGYPADTQPMTPPGYPTAALGTLTWPYPQPCGQAQQPYAHPQHPYAHPQQPYGASSYGAPPHGLAAPPGGKPGAGGQGMQQVHGLSPQAGNQPSPHSGPGKPAHLYKTLKAQAGELTVDALAGTSKTLGKMADKLSKKLAKMNA